MVTPCLNGGSATVRRLAGVYSLQLAWRNPNGVTAESGRAPKIALHVNGYHFRTDWFWVSQRPCGLSQMAMLRHYIYGLRQGRNGLKA